MMSLFKKYLKKLIFKLSSRLYNAVGFSHDFYLFSDLFLNPSDESITIFEVGAHFGVDTFKLSKLFPTARIYAFEPDSRNFQVLSKLDTSPYIHIFNQALSDRVGSAKFYMSMSTKPNFSKFLDYPWIDKSFFNSNSLSRSGASSLLNGHEALNNAKESIVSTTTLDKFCSEHYVSSIDLLWVDVQGAEKLVINGASLTLKHVRYIWIEYGFVQYKGGLDRQATIDALSPTHRVSNQFSDSSPTGNLFFINNSLQ